MISRGLIAFGVAVILVTPVRAQKPIAASKPATPATAPRAGPDSAEALSLFLDCNVGGCDFDFLRTQLTWVNYVRDRTAAQVYVLATALGTGGGGSQVTLRFLGQKAFAGVNDEIRYTNAPGASANDLRSELARVLKIGLARYVVRTRLGRNLTVTYKASSGAPAARDAHDPWNFWVFALGFSGYLSGESQSTSRGGSGSVTASRTTADWKFRAGLSGNTDRSSYNLDDSTTYVARSHSYYGSSALVRSVTSHLSLGGTVAASSSTQQNIDFSLRVAPTVEYDFLRYDQYSRRRIVASYTLGLDSYAYIDTTIFNRIKETRLDEKLSLSYATTQPWGNASIALTGSHYLSDMSQNRLSLSTGMSIRLARGLQLGYYLSYSRVRDQLSLVRSGASDTEILLRLRQLATSYTYGGNFSISYTFGSLFNNVVNPRMGF